MVDKNYKNDKLYTQTKIMYMRFIMRSEREREREQINKQIQRIGENKGNRNRRKEIGKRRKEQDK